MRKLSIGCIIAIVLALAAMASSSSSSVAAAATGLSKCPGPGQWVMTVWLGASGTPTGEAMKTCSGQIDSGWTLGETGWLGYKNDPSIPAAAQTLKTLDQYQPLMLKGFKAVAPLPYPACVTDVTMPPIADSSKVYEGYWGPNAPSRLIIEKLDAGQATVVYVVTLPQQTGEGQSRSWTRVSAIVKDGSITWGGFTFVISSDLTTVSGKLVIGGSTSNISMTRCSLPQS